MVSPWIADFLSESAPAQYTMPRDDRILDLIGLGTRLVAGVFLAEGSKTTASLKWWPTIYSLFPTYEHDFTHCTYLPSSFMVIIVF